MEDKVGGGGKERSTTEVGSRDKNELMKLCVRWCQWGDVDETLLELSCREKTKYECLKKENRR